MEIKIMQPAQVIWQHKTNENIHNTIAWEDATELIKYESNVPIGVGDEIYLEEKEEAYTVTSIRHIIHKHNRVSTEAYVTPQQIFIDYPTYLKISELDLCNEQTEEILPDMLTDLPAKWDEWLATEICVKNEKFKTEHTL